MVLWWSFKPSACVRSRQTWVSYVLLSTGILLLAALLRFAGLPQMPPGVSHDEVAEVIIAKGVLVGGHALFFEEAYGQEPLFIYLLAGVLVLLGENVLALRFVTAAVGLLTVAASARLARRLFNARVSLVTAAGMAVMLWPVFWSRVGLRGMTLPLMLCLGWDALWAALQRPPARRRGGKILQAGIFLGLSAYTYSAARGLPLLFVAFAVYLWLFRSLMDPPVEAGGLRLGFFGRVGRPLLAVGLIAALLALPLVVYLSRNPEVQSRVYEVGIPLEDLRQGRPRLVLENIPRVLGMFTVRGDFTVRNNAPHRPVFPEFLWAVLFYLGVVITGVAWIGDARYALILIWLAVMLSPSIVTTEAPNFVRTLGALPMVMLLPAVGAEGITMYLRKCAPDVVGLWCGILGVAGLLNAAMTVSDYQAWSEIGVTHFVWQSDLAAIAQRLDASPQLKDVMVSGVSNLSMDDLTLTLLMRRDDVRVRWVDTGSPLSAGGACVVPEDGGGLFVPSFVPISALLSHQLAPLTLRREIKQSFTAYHLSAYPQRTEGQTRATFEGNVSLMAVHTAAAPDMLMAGQPLVLWTVWQAGASPYPPLKVFVHVMDGAGTLRAQHDGLDSPSRFWYPGDVILQVHRVVLPEDLAAGIYELRVGLYNPETLQPYLMVDGRPFFEAGRVRVYDGR